MSEIRSALAGDLPQVVKLHRLAFGTASSLTDAALESHFAEVLFNGPSAQADSASLVHVDEHGRVAGFIGVLERSMTFFGDPIRVAVPTQLMVHPDWGSGFSAIRLLKAVFIAGYDLVLSDGATDPVRKLWTRLGGSVSYLHSLTWARPLRPCLLSCRTLAHVRPWLRLPSKLITPMSAVVDHLAARSRPNRFLFEESTSLVAEQPSLDELASGIALLRQGPLLPDRDTTALVWQLRIAAQKRPGGLQQVLLRTRDGTLCGAYLYYPSRNRSSDVLHLSASPRYEGQVFTHLMRHAWRSGAMGLSGMMDPAFMNVMGEHRCYFSRNGPWTLCYTSRPEIDTAIRTGQAVLSRLDSEYWMRFL